MNIHLISPPEVEGTSPLGERAAGLADAADAAKAAGLDEDLDRLGAPVVRRIAPRLPDNARTDDPVMNLGLYNALVSSEVSSALGNDARPLLVGGTCNHFPGMLGGFQQHFGTDARIGLIWLDAHGDFNTPRTSASGMLGGMPVAVSAGLCHASWREAAGLTTPIPTDRIVMVDVRNLDPKEEQLIHATDVTVASFEKDGGADAIFAAIDDLASRVDHLYLHVDADILDESLQPNHPTAEPGGPDVDATTQVIERAMATGKIRAFGVVSINPTGEGGEISLRSGLDLVRNGVKAWGEPAHNV
jgi:arginase